MIYTSGTRTPTKTIVAGDPSSGTYWYYQSLPGRVSHRLSSPAERRKIQDSQAKKVQQVVARACRHRGKFFVVIVLQGFQTPAVLWGERLSRLEITSGCSWLWAWGMLRNMVVELLSHEPQDLQVFNILSLPPFSSFFCACCFFHFFPLSRTHPQSDLLSDLPLVSTKCCQLQLMPCHTCTLCHQPAHHWALANLARWLGKLGLESWPVGFSCALLTTCTTSIEPPDTSWY